MEYENTGELIQKYDEWMSWDKNTDTLREIKSYYDAKDYNKLAKVLLNRISFGTAGLRSIMAAGYTCMNDLVVVQTAQGLLKYLEESHHSLLKLNGIVIGYDCRYNSKRFSELTAAIFLHKGYPVHLFSAMVPTPFIPFAVSKWKCAAGVVVTASHNPKEDNGYKVYGFNGSQIISPMDKHIQAQILRTLEPWATSWNTDIINNNDKVHDPLKDTLECYTKAVGAKLLKEHKAINLKTGVKFTYSAMHGVGYSYLLHLFKDAHLSLIAVEEQKDPDPEFPTVKFPNPEEGKSSLHLSFKTADEQNSPIILANDPDADRLAVAEKDPKSGQWRVFNGNEIGALLGWWMLHCHQSAGTDPLHNCYFLSSTVSSKILKSIAKAEGINFIETLTGFKWMGNITYNLVHQNKKVIFAFEEAIGFMVGDIVLDKDGLNAAINMGTLTSYLYNHNLTLAQQLHEIYKEYGYHLSCNSYFICRDPVVIQNIFERLRNHDGKPSSYPPGILNNKYTITSVRDLTTGFDSGQPDNKAILPVSKSSQMITFNFSNSLVATLRTSGTEPKIKYYTEICGHPTQKHEELREILKEMVDAIVSEFLQPVLNGLIPKTD